MSASQTTPLKVFPKSFNLTESPDSLPPTLRDVECIAFYLEFLQLPVDKSSTNTQKPIPKNQAVLKINFAKKVLDYAAVRVSMDVDHEYKSDPSVGGIPWQVGKLIVKPVTYSGESLSSASTYQLQIKARPQGQGHSQIQGNLQVQNSQKLGAFLDPLISRNMHEFDCNCIDNRYCGCRDFMCQTLHILSQEQVISTELPKGLTDIPPEKITRNASHVYSRLGFCFGREEIRPNDIEMDRFRTYSRCIDPKMMPYKPETSATKTNVPRTK